MGDTGTGMLSFWFLARERFSIRSLEGFTSVFFFFLLFSLGFWDRRSRNRDRDPGAGGMSSDGQCTLCTVSARQRAVADDGIRHATLGFFRRYTVTMGMVVDFWRWEGGCCGFSYARWYILFFNAKMFLSEAFCGCGECLGRSFRGMWLPNAISQW